MYAKVVKKVGVIKTTDLSDILPEEVEEPLKAAVEVRMGTDIAEEDQENITALRPSHFHIRVSYPIV